ncbi:NAD(P)/FAD-dependent oxidoreductase [Sulfitobacter geojensis]|uniref:FAD-binding oxidoreductase n=1 Tax=Sulfitobacter geojensis TaxID=1342299 RepID=A0AAE2W0D3_9RHOB|nr:FAD-dependent oxidoreductase [Sulfitobacter geojensis]MBM1690739.1 FAD-binding oxidoreductase [Sulfitobacter geojensis]MBM1694805.1 FAD-binding oxidoreductase [Sulfitobacter geojensis]MBM1707041.1 FAD-binding oxidoreductase [Sulfitobacter geojensis]MBM1711099.1 FAD-binding oxidoreductase [Sulfitobacter geojensis]MBM1715165.1 FAD-binding oxidoreductase [Sulfitobacter geojensis]
MSQESLRVGVVGGGIVGICTALSLQEAGHTVTLIERDLPGQGASFGNAGIISPWSIVPQAMPGIWKQIPEMLLRPDGPAAISLRQGPSYLPWFMRFLRQSSPDKVKATSEAMQFLCGDSISLYRHHLKGTGHEDLIADAMYVHAFRNADAANLNGLGYQMRREAGAALELIQAAELRDLEPDLAHDFQAAILIKGQARARDPGRIGAVFAQKITQQGGTVLQETVKDLRPNQSLWHVVTDTQTRVFDKVVLTAGIWSTGLLKKLGIRVPLAAERGYHVAYERAIAQLNNSVMDTDAMAVASSMNTGIRVAGTAEFGAIASPPNPKRIKSLRRVAEQMVPKLKGAKVETWMGIRPSFPDSLPLIEEFAQHPGLIGAFGHSHYGLMMAPKTGRIVADIVSGKPLNTDLSAFSAERF